MRRLRRRRSRIGGLRTRPAAVGQPRRLGRPDRGRRQGRPAGDRGPDRVLQAVGNGGRLALRLDAAGRRRTNRVHQLPRGRVLGGTSSINGMVYLRGAAGDYDSWADRGLRGLGLVERASSLRSHGAAARPGRPGRSQPAVRGVPARRQSRPGYPINPFFDSGSLDGVGWNRSTIANGRRNSSYRAFVAPVVDRPNLTVLTDTTVDRLIIDRRGNVSGLEIRTARGQIQPDRSRPRRSLCRGFRVAAAAAWPPGSARRAISSRAGDRAAGRPAGRREPDRPSADRRRLHLQASDLAPALDGHRVLRIRAVGSAPGLPRTSRSRSPRRRTSRRRPTTACPATRSSPASRSLAAGGRSGSGPPLPASIPIVDPNYLSEPEDLRSLIEGIRMTRAAGRRRRPRRLECWRVLPRPRVRVGRSAGGVHQGVGQHLVSPGRNLPHGRG